MIKTDHKDHEGDWLKVKIREVLERPDLVDEEIGKICKFFEVFAGILTEAYREDKSIFNEERE